MADTEVVSIKCNQSVGGLRFGVYFWEEPESVFRFLFLTKNSDFFGVLFSGNWNSDFFKFSGSLGFELWKELVFQ